MNAGAFDATSAAGAPTTLALALEALRGLRPRHLAAALAASLVFAIMHGFFLFRAYAKGQALLPKVPGLLLAGILLVLAVVVADAYVRRGARSLVAYGAAVFVSALVTSVGKWYLTTALGGQNFFEPHVPLAVQRTEMLFTSIFQMVVSGFGIAAYLQWREREAMSRRLQASELRRAQGERHMQQTQLRTLQARIEPELLFAALQRVGELAETATARAERLLDDVIALLRRLMPGDVLAADRLGTTVEDELAIAAAYLRVRDGCDGVTRELDVSIAADAAAARLPPMLLLPLVRAILRREGAVHTALAIRACLDGDALTLVFSRRSDDAGEPLVDRADLDALRQRLDDNFGAGVAHAGVVDRPATLALRLPFDHEPEQTDRAHR